MATVVSPMPAMAAASQTTAGPLLITGLLFATSATAVWPGHVEYSLGILDGTDGFVVTAESSTGLLGYSVSAAGDVNNDGFNDVILGDPPADSSTAGAAYVLYGSESFSFSRLDVSNLDGTNGFKIEGTDEGENAGTSVAGAGDVNGDGFDDVMMGAWGASSAAGEVLVVFGAASQSAVVDASDLDGTRGFVMRGATTSDAAGFSVASAGDVNNDGAADIIVGAYKADPAGSLSGAAYIVFGSITWSEDTVDLAELGAGGITLEGGDQREYVGYSVASAGDVNDDGYSDVIVAAYGANEAYVLYGAATFESDTYALNTLSGADGFILSAGNDGDVIVVAGAGDMNDDGYSDVAVGHALADPDAASNSAGATYVILGGLAISSPLDLLTGLDGTTGFVLQGSAAGDKSGTSVANAGDLNQDGYGDIVVGAPGVEDDVGAAYILFGGKDFAESYDLGSLDGDNGLVLTAPTSGGRAGFAVSGLGDINQDGYPDLAVGAYGSGTAGEAYIVFPHLTGTPPPSPAPTPAPTPAPHRIPYGPTPAPTINFLADGVVGGGTIYEAPGVFVRAQELGGEVSLGTDRWFDGDTSVSISLSELREKNLAGGLVGLGATIPHVIDGDGVVYMASATTDVTFGDIAARFSNMTAHVLGGHAMITISMYIFEESGLITSGDEQTEITAGDLKVSLSVTDWPFCDPDSMTASGATSPTVCYTASSTPEVGSYLDATILVRGPSLASPVLENGGGGGGAGSAAAAGGTGASSSLVGAGMRYGMSGGRADATLVMSEWIRTDDFGWTKAEQLSLSGSSSFTVRFPASSGTLYYDPTVELVLTPNAGEEFWEKRWLIWLVGLFGGLVVICILGFGAGTLRRRRATKDKVSPNFEGVAAPAAGSNAADADDAGARGGTAVVLGSIFCCCGGRPPSYGSARAAPASSSNSENKEAATGKRFKFPSMSCSMPKPSKQANNKTERVRAAAAAEGDRTAGASEVNVATPDWIKDLQRNAGAANVTSAVPDWLADVAGSVAKDPGGVGGGAADQQERGYYEGYDRHEGYGHDGYEGFDGYLYDGYYDAAYYDYNAGGYYGGGGSGADGEVAAQGGGGSRGNEQQKKSSTVAVPPQATTAAGGGGGGGMSWLTNAASTVNAMNECDEEDDAVGDAPAAKAGGGTGPGASRLPPIGSSGFGTNGAAAAPMPWMNAR